MEDQQQANPSEREAQIAAAHDALKKRHPLLGAAIAEMTGSFAADSLAEIDAATRQLSESLRGSSQNALQNARLLGQALWAIKLSIPEGHWTIWLENNSPYSPRRSQEFMQLARNWCIVEKAVRVNPKYDFGSLSVERAIKIMRSAHNPVPRPMRKDDKNAERSLVSRAIAGAESGEIEEEPLANSKVGKFQQESAMKEMALIGPQTVGVNVDALQALHKCLGQSLNHLLLAEIYYPPGGNAYFRKILSFAVEQLKGERAMLTRTIKDGTIVNSSRTSPVHEADLAAIRAEEEQQIAAALAMIKDLLRSVRDGG